MLKLIKRLLLLAAFMILFLSSWFAFEFLRTPKNPSGSILYEIKKGEGANSLAEHLIAAGILQKKTVFLYGHALFYSKKTIKAGEFVFELPLSINKILQIVTEGKSLLHAVTIPEGLTRMEIATHLESLGIAEWEAFMKASEDTSAISAFDPDARDLEGYLFPETYFFQKGATSERIVSAMTDQFKDTFTEEWTRKANELGFTIREIIILASLTEKETSLPEERPIVSAVFHNRLKLGMKLDCDPTIIYALKQEGQFKDRLRTKDMKLDSPYNTYLHRGLPPGPIANPGKESIKAALFPAVNDFLFFVAKNDGSHHFSRSFREHQNAVNTFQRNKR
jgi:UPF0755 protein